MIALTGVGAECVVYRLFLKLISLGHLILFFNSTFCSLFHNSKNIKVTSVVIITQTDFNG